MNKSKKFFFRKLPQLLNLRIFLWLKLESSSNHETEFNFRTKKSNNIFMKKITFGQFTNELYFNTFWHLLRIIKKSLIDSMEKWGMKLHLRVFFALNLYLKFKIYLDVLEDVKVIIKFKAVFTNFYKILFSENIYSISSISIL